MPGIVEAFTEFGLVSNFKVDYDKTEALNVSLPRTTLSRLQSTFVFKWQQKAIKYLGIRIPTLSTLADFNCIPLVRTIHTCLKSYDKPHISWFGRMNVDKID